MTPATLCGKAVRLEPLTADHASELFEVGRDPELWRLQPTLISTIEEMRAYVATALTEQQLGKSLPFVIIDRASDRVVGSTRYMDISMQHRRLEIGCSWITPTHQRTRINTEAKLLMLTYAFETLQLIRVIFKTDLLNQRSRAAIQRLGALEEGIFRQHLIADSGRKRDMIYFAILEEEWPRIKTGLTSKLAAAHL